MSLDKERKYSFTHAICKGSSTKMYIVYVPLVGLKMLDGITRLIDLLY